MYGMVNAALEALVREKFGDEVWERVKAKAGVQDVAFVAMHEYPDSVTYGLATALAVETGVPIEQLLHAYGIYWVSYADRGPWGKLMRESGETTYELLAALDAMHARIAMSFPALKPPSFAVKPEGDHVLLEYRSHRPGLAPFVLGLLEGIGSLYNEEVSAELIQPRSSDTSPDIFRVRATRKSV